MVAFASSTKPTKSRSRTLARITTIRDEFSRSILTGPSIGTKRANCAKGSARPSAIGSRKDSNKAGDICNAALPRTNKGKRRPSSITTPTVRPSIKARKSFCTCSTLKPKRPIAWRSNSTCIYCMPEFLTVMTSSLPGTALSKVTIFCASPFNTSRSGP